jgi:phosphate transport system permease protein
MENPSFDIASVMRSDSTLKLRSRRMLVDTLARWGINLGGSVAIVAIVLIFVYLLSVAVPLLRPPHMAQAAAYEAPAGEPVLLNTDEYTETAVRLAADGQAQYLDPRSGKSLGGQRLALPEGVRITAHTLVNPAKNEYVLGLSDGSVLPIQIKYGLTYPDGKRQVTPSVAYPLGETPLKLDAAGAPLPHFALRQAGDRALAVRPAAGGAAYTLFERKRSRLDEDEAGALTASGEGLIPLEHEADFLLISGDAETLFAAARDGRLTVVDVRNPGQPVVRQHERLTVAPDALTSLGFLLGDSSLLAGTQSGRISQWFGVRDPKGDGAQKLLREIRDFKADGPVLALTPESRRKGFMVLDGSGGFGVYYATSGQRLLEAKPFDRTARPVLAVTPRGDGALLENGGQLRLYKIENEHPETTLGTLWGKVWYEGYDQPEYLWQSSAATNDFEPKLSLTPLTFGTLKAAFYAMLLAAPLAILGAIYTAYFMSAPMRQTVKPAIEVMEALPTVILGFLAGLWLSPFVEHHLPGVFATLLALPLVTLITAYVWSRLPRAVRLRVPDGWESLILIPVLLLTGWLVMAASGPLEDLLFNGDMRVWLAQKGIGFDQRNSIVVGIAMGVAVIPNIFTIAEDAIFSAPKHLTFGSLALGATPWQTLMRVILLTASPGIFSALMIGFGRAVGETMIVLMATGNTPVMDFSVFTGFRALSANIAVELPESEVDSTHYRVLFLAALVLFIFTFFFNTLAELVRQRLRRRYASL